MSLLGLALVVLAPTRNIAFAEFEKTDIRVVLTYLAQTARVECHIGPEVRGFVSVSLRNVPFETALVKSLKPLDLTYRVSNDVVEILPRYNPEKLSGNPLKDERWIAPAYRQLTAALKGSGRTNAWVDRNFTLIELDGTGIGGDRAYESLSKAHRTAVRYQLGGTETIGMTGNTVTAARVFLQVQPSGDAFFDDWVRVPGKPWRLLSRSPGSLAF